MPWWVLLLCLSLQACASASTVSPPLRESPRTHTLSPSALDTQLSQAAAPTGYLGIVALIADDHEVLYQRAFGVSDLQRRHALATDAIFRLYSMTKPITSAAVLMLADEGRLKLDDPVAKYLPAFSGVQVLEVDGRLRAPVRALTLHHLLTHTSGLAIGEGPATRLRERVDPEAADDLAGYAARLSRVPLAADPGTVFAYDGAATQLLSRIVEVVSGRSLGTFFDERFFVPLGMRDTGFEVPLAQRHRVVDITTFDNGSLRIADGPSATTPGAALNAYQSGAGGLYSTAADYLRFCRMLLAGGTLDGHRYLQPQTVHAMMQNQLGHLAQPSTTSSEHEGFGFGLSVQLDPAARGRLGPPGQVGWSGAASTYFVIDPERHLIAILLAQHLPRDVAGDLPRLSTPFYNLVQQSVSP
jgi:CubicO group peptidase (beta-lactamase class C family)